MNVSFYAELYALLNCCQRFRDISVLS